MLHQTVSGSARVWRAGCGVPSEITHLHAGHTVSWAARPAALPNGPIDFFFSKSAQPSHNPAVLIVREAQLLELADKLRDSPWVAMDTEADSLHAYPEKICLIQISHPGGDVLVDPLAGLNLRPLWAALSGRELIMHGCDYDLRLLRRSFDYLPGAVFDTMLAARLLGYTAFGLSDLVARHLGVRLEKGPQKANWGLRPLPAHMERYARNDSHYLKPLEKAPWNMPLMPTRSGASKVAGNSTAAAWPFCARYGTGANTRR
jgi:hypothetical protein